ncbi:tRNA (adenosine(37)-N6)-threonylcarbamoyltransferase complex ATPase subunit type 1 TsaE [Bacterioplanes sanyensis]|uniref:tRNA threonylcarbamoyladenosine biosynthesis protein TsaE n=1 Tax=Bacterioplanes sanyensis TaxID=1249553 RepID=A0A222FKZ8_9GAMM|nr:tRNA (adenosine(37)-N6)-threonylcarbamoyltransferase complex ATPase subunit type 1 TsaE [Bacterioplanes sanyensis]ASP38893.1 tRNA (adenosine(37)-N6)-threonylcarbamoyltransferase complex ATPase subunit type 1 TsaE [Bacterioplanes sanyensis]
MTWQLADEDATLNVARICSDIIDGGGLVFLLGTLGAGKTTFCRGFIQALGHEGAVRSPTYTLVEEYPLSARRVCHFDLYRLGDPEELEFMGIRDYLDDDSLCLIEWPQRGVGVLPEADLVLHLADEGDGRQLDIEAGSDKGQHWLQQLQQHPELSKLMMG